MFTSLLKCLALLILVSVVPFGSGLATSGGQTQFGAARNSTEFLTLQQLHAGNQKFRESQTQAKMAQQGLTLSLSHLSNDKPTQLVVDPSFMVIGCTDDRCV